MNLENLKRRIGKISGRIWNDNTRVVAECVNVNAEITEKIVDEIVILNREVLELKNKIKDLENKIKVYEEQKQCENCVYWGKAADAPDTVEKTCMWVSSEDEKRPCKKKIYIERE